MQRTESCLRSNESGKWIARLACVASIIAALGGVLMTANAAYALQAPALWVTSFIGTDIEEFTPADLLANGSPTPVADNTGLRSTGLAFDKDHNLWAILDFFEVVEYSATELANLGSDPSPTPVTVITSLSFSSLFGCTFDRKGNLWIADEDLGVHELLRNQLLGGSALLTPAVTIDVPIFEAVNFLAFDHVGNLWASDEDRVAIYELSKRQIRTSATVTPAVAITSASISEPGQLAFDRQDALWVTDFKDDSVEKFPRKLIRKTGNPAPSVIITASSSNLNGPWGLTFDESENLWVSNFNDGKISKYFSTQIRKSGNPVPAVTITNPSADETYQITFGPAF
ncbi:MAG: hypothetical protein WAM05_12245 [Candidatus Binataceae bacterium]